MRRWNGGWILVALLVGLTAAWSADMTLMGRDIVQASATGAPRAAEDLLRDGTWSLPDVYPWPTQAETLHVMSNSALDSGYVVVAGLDSSWLETVDSAYVAGGSVGRIPGWWRRVNGALFRDDELNVGTLRVFTSSYHDSTKVLAQIEPGAGRSYEAVYTVPGGRAGVVPMVWRVTHVATSRADTFYTGSVQLMAREPNDTWHIVDQVTIQSGQGPVVMAYDERTWWPIAGRADLAVGAALSGSVNSLVDITTRFDFGLR